jgi:hypothetical protein
MRCMLLTFKWKIKEARCSYTGGSQGRMTVSFFLFAANPFCVFLEENNFNSKNFSFYSIQFMHS